MAPVAAAEAAGPGGRRREAVTGALIALAALVAHLPALGAGLIFDDGLFLTDNPVLRGPIQGCFGTGGADWQPATQLSFWFGWRLFGAAPAAHHLVNVLLHAAAVVLLWRILARLRVPGAALAASLFAVHPVAAGSVAWVAERKNVLSGALLALAVLLFLADEDRPSPRIYAASVASFALAILSKGSVVVLPACLLLLAWYRRGALRRADLLRVAPFAALGVAGAAVTIWFQRFGAIRGARFDPGGPLVRLLGASRAVWFYAEKAYWPVELVFFYPRWRISAGAPGAWVPLAALLGAVWLAWSLRARWGRGPVAALGWFALALAPALGFVDLYWLRYSWVADHLAYLALPAPLAAVAALLVRRGEDPGGARRRVAAGLALLALAGLAGLSWSRCRALSSPEALWRDTLARNGEAYVAHLGLAELLPPGPERIGHLRAAARLDPIPSDAADEEGLALKEEGRAREATAAFARAVALAPDNSIARRHYAQALHEAGSDAEAAAQLRDVVAHLPGCPECRYELGVVLAGQGRLGEAVAEVEVASRLRPDDRVYAASLGTLRAALAGSVAAR